MVGLIQVSPMKRRWYWVASLLVMVGVAACRQADIREKTIAVPQMKNASCETIVVEALRKTDGVFADKIRAGGGQVTVTYDSMKLALKNLEFAIASAGFDAGTTPADPKAREALPADCR